MKAARSRLRVLLRHVRHQARRLRRQARRLWRQARRLWRQVRLLVRRAYRRGLRLKRRLGVALARHLPVPIRLLGLNHEFARRAVALEPDVIHAHDLNTLLAGVLATRVRPAPLVYDSHELFLERNLGQNSRRVDRRVWGPVERRCIGHCDAVLSVSAGICRELETRYGIESVELIRNVQPYEPPPESSTLLHDDLGLAHDTRIAIYPGGITFHRGLELLIESAPFLDDGTVYVIMGYALNSQYLEGLRRQAAALGMLDERVFFRDAVPMADVLRYIVSARVGVVPTINACLSYYYEASNKMFHCLMAGVPLVMSDHSEKRLLAERYGVGVLFDETGPARNLADGVNALLGDSRTYERMVAASLSAARTLNWEHEQHRLRTIYADLLGDRAPAPVPPPVIPEQAPATA